MLPAIVAIAAALLARTSPATIHLAPRFGTISTTTTAAAQHNEPPRGRGGDEATPRLAAGGEPSSSAPLASIDSGVLRGTVEIAADGSKMNSFRGVPYGEPPVNARRWEKVKRNAPWIGERIADRDAAGCAQVCTLPHAHCPGETSEDCLYLNIFTPTMNASASGTGMPVLIFIHGGHFLMGHSGGPAHTPGGHFRSDMVVVAMNYRLGALGFAYSEVDEPGDVGNGGGNASPLKGNYGLADQRLAMKWVQTNVHAFGGDPTRVTLVGTDAGAISIAAHLVMDKSDGLFERVILQSPAFAIPLQTSKTFPALMLDFAAELGCATSPFNDTCVRKAALADIVAAQTSAAASTVMLPFTTFTPFVSRTASGGEIAHQLLRQLETYARGGGVSDTTPLLLGTALNDGVRLVYELAPVPLDAAAADALVARIFYTRTGTAAQSIIAQFPKAAAVAGDDMRPWLASLVADGLYRCSARRAAMTRDRAAVAPTPSPAPAFQYHFDHAWSFNKDLYSTIPVCQRKRVCGGSALPAVFGIDTLVHHLNVTSVVEPIEERLSDAMLRYWHRFASSRDGTPKRGNTDCTACNKSAALPLWTSINELHRPTVRFIAPGSDEPAADGVVVEEVGVDAARCAFWDSTNYAWVDVR